MPHAKKVVLVAESGSVLARDDLLTELFEDRIELFCALGKDAEGWEDAMDWICVAAKVEHGIEHFVLTSKHESESLEEVIEFAKQVSIPSGDTQIEVIRV
jgi:hypothetical protein